MLGYCKERLFSIWNVEAALLTSSSDLDNHFLCINPTSELSCVLRTVWRESINDY